MWFFPLVLPKTLIYVHFHVQPKDSALVKGKDIIMHYQRTNKKQQIQYQTWNSKINWFIKIQAKGNMKVKKTTMDPEKFKLSHQWCQSINNF